MSQDDFKNEVQKTEEVSTRGKIALLLAWLMLLSVAAFAAVMMGAC